MKNKLYFGLDGDSIGRQVVAFFIANQVDELKEFSRNIEEALHVIKDAAKSRGGEIIYCTGDSILFCGEIDPSFGNEIVDIFLNLTKKKASVGIGTNLTNAYLGLTLAKAQGGNRSILYKNQ